MIAATCHGAAGRATVSVCGEFAADERAVQLLVGLGVGALSVTPPAVPGTKEAVRAVDSREARRLADELRSATGAEDVRKRLG